MPLSSLPPPPSSEREPSPTALFGGAFDPPHLGHVLAAVHAVATGGAGRVWVLPTAQHPWGKRTRPFAERLELCRLAFAGLAFVEVRADEEDNPSGTTWDLLDLLEQREPGTRFVLIGGTDTGRDLPRWHRGAELARRLPVLVIPRRPLDDHPAALPAISSSLVRERLAAGLPVDDLVPAAVARRLRPS
jgi:nicotinate-nucleotide adenylyltransferase